MQFLNLSSTRAAFIFAMTCCLFAGTATGARVTVSDVETDTTTGGFPNGVDGEWTRFGAAFNGMSIDANPANANGGTNSLQAAADWSAGTSFNVVYNVAGASFDASADPRISYAMNFDGVGNPLVLVEIVETDGDIWQRAAGHTLTVAYQVFEFVITTPGNFVLAAAGGDSILNTAQIAFVRFRIEANGAASGAPVFHIDDLQHGAAANPGTSITDIETDSSTAGFPSGVDGEWTRFGAGFNGLSIDNDPNESAGGLDSLNASVNWGGGTFMGVRYNIPGASINLSAEPRIGYQLKYDGGGTGAPNVLFVFEEADGDLWESTSGNLPTTGYVQVFFDLVAGNFNLATAGGDSIFDVSAVALIGFTIQQNGATGVQVLHVDNVVSGNAVVPVELSGFTID